MLIAKTCPVCGCPAIIESTSMDKGNGRGYPGEFWYTCHCPNCDYIEPGNGNTVYETRMEAIHSAIDEWNQNVEKFEKIVEEKNKGGI